MSQDTSIAWTDSTWNPVRGCSRVSEGCRNCYAEKVAARFSWPPSLPQEYGDRGGPYHGFATAKGWTGKVGLVAEKLYDPLHWRKPRRIFVNSMSDLFHESLPDEAIDRVFAVMALASRHTFQVLTKRAARMRHYFRDRDACMVRWGFHATGILDAIYSKRGGDPIRNAEAACADARKQEPTFPLPNVWLGVSAEDQARADERIPLLLETPAAVRFVSAEPLLGPLHFGATRVPEGERLHGWAATYDALSGASWLAVGDEEEEGADARAHRGLEGARLDWVIVGGESGPEARPCDLAWIRSIVTQCKEAGVAAFVKQLGAAAIGEDDGVYGAAIGCPAHAETFAAALRDRKGGDPAEWPKDLRVQEFPS